MNVLIVFAHPNRHSFNGRLLDHAVQTLSDEGHEVRVSDLYAMGFKAVADIHDFTNVGDESAFDVQKEQARAYREGNLPEGVREEHEKLIWADAVIFQFPLWWNSVPAILKGWFDRVLVPGFSHGLHQWFDHGGFHGKKALVVTTTGSGAATYGADGIFGDINDLLRPILHGTLYFVGFEVQPPFIAWGGGKAHAVDEARMLEEFTRRLLEIEKTASMPYRSMDDFEEDGRLKISLRQRHRKTRTAVP